MCLKWSNGIRLALLIGLHVPLNAQESRTEQERLALFRSPGLRAINPDEIKSALQKLATPLGAQSTATQQQERRNALLSLAPHIRAISAANMPEILSYKYFTRAVEQRRTDQRITAGSPASGANTAATQAGTLDFIGAALQSGAVVQTFSQNVLTFTSNAESLWEFLMNEQVVNCDKDPNNGVCKSDAHNLAFSASFDVSKGGTQTLTGTAPGSSTPETFTIPASSKQFSGATLQYAVLNPRSPASKENRGKWLRFTQKIYATRLNPGDPLYDYIARLMAQLKPEDLALAPTSMADVNAELNNYRAVDPDFERKIAEYNAQFLRREFADLASGDHSQDPELSLLYTFAEPVAEPKLHNFKIAGNFSPRAKSGGAALGTLTYNFALDLYHDAQPNLKGGTSHIRDAQFVIDFTRPFDSQNKVAAISFAGYFQYMISPGIIVPPAGTTTPNGIPLPAQASVLLAPKGFIGIAEVKATVKLGESGTTVPIGLTWANRTDLIKANEVRGHVGFTFDSFGLFGK